MFIPPSVLDRLAVVLDHLAPLAITVAAVLAFIFYKHGVPYIRHIALVAGADDDAGIIRLAKFLANRAGGKRINVDETWQDFIPAAIGLRADHVEKKEQSHHLR